MSEHTQVLILLARERFSVDEWGALSNVQRNWEDNFTQIAPYVDVTIPSHELAAIEAYVHRFFRERGGLLESPTPRGTCTSECGRLSSPPTSCRRASSA